PTATGAPLYSTSLHLTVISRHQVTTLGDWGRKYAGSRHGRREENQPNVSFPTAERTAGVCPVRTRSDAPATRSGAAVEECGGAGPRGPPAHERGRSGPPAVAIGPAGRRTTRPPRRPTSGSGRRPPAATPLWSAPAAGRGAPPRRRGGPGGSPLSGRRPRPHTGPRSTVQPGSRTVPAHRPGAARRPGRRSRRGPAPRSRAVGVRS